MNSLLHFFFILNFFILTGCMGAKHSFSLPAVEESFQQSGMEVIQRKIDILWVVDNSGSMAPFQQNLTANFQDFIQDFIQKDYDFHIAVTTTDAYLADPQFRNALSFSAFKNGNSSGISGFPIINRQTPDILLNFSLNALQGATGSGDERPFSSFKAALDNPNNSGFLRKGSFLAVIILSDEDDFSNPTRPERTSSTSPLPDQDYAAPGLESVDSYISYLDHLTGSHDPLNRNYTVSAVTALNKSCALLVGLRIMELVHKTGGVIGDICTANYSTVLQNIQKKILDLSTEFPLNRKPRLGSIRITVNGIPLPEDSENGWTYNPTKNTIQFHGTGVPPHAATVMIAYDPAEPLKPDPVIK